MPEDRGGERHEGRHAPEKGRPLARLVPKDEPPGRDDQRRFLAPRQGEKPGPLAARLVVLSLAALLILLGLWPEPLIYLSQAAARVLTGGAG